MNDQPKKAGMRFGIGAKTILGYATFAIVEDPATHIAAIQVGESDHESDELSSSTHFFLTAKSARLIAAALTEWADERTRPRLVPDHRAQARKEMSELTAEELAKDLEPWDLERVKS
jgi:hypothetical protein